MLEARAGLGAGGIHKGIGVLCTSENRALAILEVLVHLTDLLPDKPVLATVDIPDDMPSDEVTEGNLPPAWDTLIVQHQAATRKIGNEWIQSRRSAVPSVPSVVSGEKNLLLNPEHPAFGRIALSNPVPFRFDVRLLREQMSGPIQPGQA